MARPNDQYFDLLTGTLGYGSVTIFGITFYANDPAAEISVTSDHRLSFTFSPLPPPSSSDVSPRIVGYKSADGSNFNPFDSAHPSLLSLSLSSGTNFSTDYAVFEYRDGTQVAVTSFISPATPTRIDISGINYQSKNIDQVEIYCDPRAITVTIDDLQFSDPAPGSYADPTISNLSGNITYIERSAPVALDSRFDALVDDSDSADFAGGALTVVLSGARSEDKFGIAIDTAGVTLSSGMAAGSTVSVQGTSIGTIRSGATGIAGQSLAIDLNGNANAANVSTLLHTLTYSDSATPDPTAGTRTATVTLQDGDGGSTTVEVGVAVVAVNDAPTFRATATNPTFTEGGNAVLLFSNVVASTQESGQRIGSLVLTVSNVLDPSSEYLTIDGTAVSLVDGSSTTVHGATIVSSVANGVATLTVSNSGGFIPDDLARFVDRMTYEDRSEDPTTTASRVVTLTSIRDTGGTGNGGVDTTALSISSVVSLQAVNDAPVITSLGGRTTAQVSVAENLTAVTTVTAGDVDGPGPLVYAIAGGADKNLFAIASNGNLSFLTAPDYEHPGSAAGTNDYAVTVQVSDRAGGTDTQALTIHVTDVTDPDTLVLHVSQNAYQGDAQFVVLVDGVQAGGTQTAHAAHGSGAPDTVTLYGDFASANQVAVQFVNDALGGSAGQDRNLYVDDVTLNGQRQSGSAAAVSPNVGFAKGDGSVVLATNGAAVFNFGGSGPDTLVFHVSENRYLGDAQFVVLVDGRQIGGTQTAHAAHGSGAPDAITLHGSFGEGTHDVAVRFVNDLYGGSSAADRNLHVDDVSLNGHLKQGSEATVSSSVGFAQGSSVVLATNGDALFHFDLHA